MISQLSDIINYVYVCYVMSQTVNDQKQCKLKLQPQRSSKNIPPQYMQINAPQPSLKRRKRPINTKIIIITVTVPQHVLVLQLQLPHVKSNHKHDTEAVLMPHEPRKTPYYPRTPFPHRHFRRQG